MRTLIAFYQDEQYWVRRARTIVDTRETQSARNEQRSAASRAITHDNTRDLGSSRRAAFSSLSRTPPPRSPAHSDSEDEDDGMPWPSSIVSDDRMEVDDPRTRPRSPPHLLPHINAFAEPQRRRHSFSHGERPVVSGTQILDLYADLLLVRMQSCQRMARIVEMREARRRRTLSWG